MDPRGVGQCKKPSSELGNKDSPRLASASSDGTVKIWNVDKSECVMTLQEGNKTEYHAVPSPDKLISITKMKP